MYRDSTQACILEKKSDTKDIFLLIYCNSPFYKPKKKVQSTNTIVRSTYNNYVYSINLKNNSDVCICLSPSGEVFIQEQKADMPVERNMYRIEIQCTNCNAFSDMQKNGPL